jgi:predicted ATP pyrophosphatase (TIGR00289 family)
MRVAILFSGGKDSTYAAKYCMDNGFDIVSLISVKPRNEEAYLWHYPTVELCKLSADAMGLPIALVRCEEIGPNVEARCLEPLLAKMKIDALVLGGVGLQETQIKEIAKVAEKFNINVVVPHKDYTSEQLLREEIAKGLEIVITEVATGGLDKDWLGRIIDERAFEALKHLSEKHGFDILGEGGAFNTFVTDAPFFKQRIELVNPAIVWDTKTRSGYIVSDAMLTEKMAVKV